MTPPTLTTNRLTLRAITCTDFEPYAAMWADSRVTSFIGGDPRDRQTSWSKFCQSVGLWPLLGYGYWLFEERSSGEMVGLGGLACFERGIAQLDGFPEAGWAFAADHWGKGYASEAVVAIVHWSDTVLGVPELRCIIDPQNTPSIRVAQKCGFTQIDEVKNELGRSLVFARRHP
jgi:RimJ/RimL family protein N-acetyltransferase